MSRLLPLVLVLVALSFSPAFSQLEKGINRVGLSGYLTTVHRLNQASLMASFGELLTDHFELLAGLEVSVYEWERNTRDSETEVGGSFRGGALYHFNPSSKNVFGMGGSLGLRLYPAEDTHSYLANLLFNYDHFISRDWSFGFTAGYEHEDFDGNAESQQGLVARFGFSHFLGAKR